MVKKLLLLVLVGGAAALNAAYTYDDYESQINYFKAEAANLRRKADGFSASESDPEVARHRADVYKSVAHGFDIYSDYYRKMQKNGGDNPALRERFHTLQANQKRAEALSRKMLQRRYQQLGKNEDAKWAGMDAEGAYNSIKTNEYFAERERAVVAPASKTIPSSAATRQRRSSERTASARKRAGSLRQFRSHKL